MDSFFSSAETAGHPELVGLPVVVGADPKEGAGRGNYQHMFIRSQRVRDSFRDADLRCVSALP